MRTLLIEPTPAGNATVAGALDAAGHDVVRCHPADGPAFPCVGLTDEGCPLERGLDVDVAVAVRDEVAAAPRADEAGVTCAIRTGIPVVVLGPRATDGGVAHPFEPWAETCHEPDDLPNAIDRAIDAAADRRAAPLQAEAERVLATEGVDAGEVRVEVRRDGTTARILLRTEVPLEVGLANSIATRLHAVDAAGSWPTSKLSVAVGTL